MWVWWLKKCGLWLLGLYDFLVLNFLGLWLRDLMILLELKMRTKFPFWAYDFFFELNFLGFYVCLFLKKIFGDKPKEHEHVLQKKIMKEINFFNLIILFYFKRILKKWKKYFFIIILCWLGIYKIINNFIIIILFVTSAFTVSTVHSVCHVSFFC